jgi:hypothetical protein
MKAWILSLAALLFVGAGIASAQTGNGFVRVVHASPDAPAVDIYVESNIVLEALPFREYSDYLPVPAGTYTVSIKVSGTDTTVKSFPVTIGAGRYYTAIAVGYAGGGQPGFDVLALEDDLALPGNNGVKLRVVHGAPGAPEVDIYVTTPFETLTGKAAALTRVPFKASSPYLTVPTGTYQARVAVAGTKTIAIDSGRLITWNNMIRTVIAVDSKGGGAPFDILILPDRN